MEIKDFIGKTVVDPKTNKKYVIYEITSPLIETSLPEPPQTGSRIVYRYHTINGDPFSSGELVFEDASLLAPFLKAYDTHCRSEEGRMEEYEYWSRRA